MGGVTEATSAAHYQRLQGGDKGSERTCAEMKNGNRDDTNKFDTRREVLIQQLWLCISS